MFVAQPSVAYDFADVKTLQIAAIGKIRQVGVLAVTLTDTVSTMANTAQSIKDELDTLHMPLSIIITPDIKGDTINDLTDLSTLDNNGISIDIAQDGANLGSALYVLYAFSIGSLGALLGTLSASGVQEDPGYVEKFNQVEGAEFDVPALSNGQLISAISKTALNYLNNKRYMFMLKYVGSSGTYYVGGHCACGSDNDFAYIPDNRVIDKASREVYKKLLPKINANVKLDATTGKIDADAVKFYEELGNQALEQMSRSGEISGFMVVIDPDQDIASTGVMEVKIANVPMTVIRRFNVNIGFKTKLS